MTTSSKFRNRPSHVPIPAERRPDILFLCSSGFAAETIITLLECAEYSITQVATMQDAMDWLRRRRFSVAVLDSGIVGHEEFRAEAKTIGLPVVEISTEPNDFARTGITSGNVKEMLATLFRLAPLEWMKRVPQRVGDDLRSGATPVEKLSASSSKPETVHTP